MALRKIIIFLFVLFTLLFTASAVNAEDNFVTVGPIILQGGASIKIPNYSVDVMSTSEDGSIKFETRRIISYTDRSSFACPVTNGVCVPAFQIKANPSSDPAAATKITIGDPWVTDSYAPDQVQIAKPTKTEWLLTKNGSTGNVTFEIKLNASKPEISLSLDREINKNEAQKVTVALIPPFIGSYNIYFGELSSNNVLERARIIVLCSSGSCRISNVNNPSNLLTGVELIEDSAAKRYHLSFVLPNNSLKEGTTYAAKVEYIVNGKNESAQKSFGVLDNRPMTLKVRIEPNFTAFTSETLSKTDLGLIVDNATNAKYNVFIGSQGASIGKVLDCKNLQTSQGRTCNSAKDFLNDLVRTLPEGTHYINVQNVNNKDDYGRVIIRIGAQTAGSGRCTPDDIKRCEERSKDGKKFICQAAGVCTEIAPASGQTCPKDKPGINTAIGCIPTEPSSLVRALLTYIIGFAGGIALLLMIFASFQWITSAGNPDSIKKAGEQFSAAIIGLLFIIFSTLLLQIIGVDILNLPGFS